MAYPAMIQNFAIWSRRGEDTWDIYPDGHPVVEDLVMFAPWRSLRSEMSYWSLVPADTAGCVQLGNPKKVMDIAWDLRNGPVPLVVLLEHLARGGWQRTSSAKDSLAIHTLETPRVMHLSGSASQDKAYLQCLACLEDILSPSLPSLASKRPAAYYQTILQPQLELAVLPPPGQDSGNHEARASDSTEEEPVLEHPTGHWAGQPTPRVSRKRKLTEASGIDDALMVPLPTIEQPNEVQEQPGQSMGRGDAAQPREILANVEGVNIVRDTHLLPGMPGHYDRGFVRCPLHSGSGVFCTKTRVFGPRTMAKFGQKEPVAFLASWICAASRFTDRVSHMKHRPGHAEVCAAMANLRGSGVEG